MTITDLEELETKLDEVPCKPRLFATRLFALQLLTGRKLDELIDTKIVQPLTKLTEFQGSQIKYIFTDEIVKVPSWSAFRSTSPEQFIDDFAAHGLRKAILNFHTYEFLGDTSELIDNAISVYHDIAKFYLENVEKLEASHDRKIQKMMRLKEIPRHRYAEKLYLPNKRLYEKPETDVGKLWEYIHAEFSIGRICDFERAIVFIADFLYAHDYDIRSEVGQSILGAFVADVKDDVYGGFECIEYCVKCSEQVILEFSLECANQALEQRILCPKCSEEYFFQNVLQNWICWGRLFFLLEGL